MNVVFPLTTAKEESNYDLEEGGSSSESSTDTTDIDEVCMCDILYCVLITCCVNTACRLETLKSW